jgi:transcriptional regulator of acetoin/glycerol metabolism
MSLQDLEEALQKHKGNIQRMAREIGVTRRALYYHFKNKNIDPDKYRA